MAPVPDVCPVVAASETWLDRQFVETALRLGCKAPKLGVNKYEVKAAVGKGENYCSDLYRIKIYSSDGKTHNLIIKKKLEEGDFADLVNVSSAFSREIQMYSVTAVQLFNVLDRVMPGESEPFAAGYVYSCPGTIMVQDLCAEGFQMGGRRTGLDMNHCLLAMRTLARLHAASVAVQEQDPDSLALFDQNFFSEPASREGLSKFLTGSVKAVAKAVETWPVYGDLYAHKLHKLADNILDRIIECTLRNDNGLNVLTHGDLWVNNMLFRYSGPGGALDGIRFVDYQFVHFSSPAIDLQYFFNTSLSPEVRASHIDDLMKEYHSTLCKTLKRLGYLNKAISMEELKADYNKHVIYGVHAACCVLPIVLTDKGMDLNAVMNSGADSGQAADVFNGDFYKTALQSMLPIFEKYGAFRE